jgi:photosystem II stability/assembly factor-like uncharacterized protein
MSTKFMRPVRALVSVLSFLCGIQPSSADYIFERINDLDGSVMRHSQGYRGTVVDMEIASLPSGLNAVFIAGGAPQSFFCYQNSASFSFAGVPSGVNLGVVKEVEAGSSGSIAFLLANRLYKVTESCSQYAALTLPNGTSLGNTLIFGHSTLLVANADGSLSRSTDDGVSFSAVSVASDIREILSFSAAPTAGVFYLLAREASGARSRYRSLDSGVSWTNMGSSLECNTCRSIAVDPSNANKFVAAGPQIVRISTDGGATWTSITPPGMKNHAIRFIGTTPSRLVVGSHYTDNDGSTWSDYNDGSGEGATIVGPVLGIPGSTSPADIGLYAASRLGLEYSVAGGSSWVPISTAALALGFSVFDIGLGAASPPSPNRRAYLASDFGIHGIDEYQETGSLQFATTDPQNVGFSNNPVFATIVPDPTIESTALAGTNGAIYRTTNSGAAWTAAVVMSDIFGAQSRVTRFALVSKTQIVASYRNIDSATGGVLRSVDSGQTWADLVVPGGPPMNTILVSQGVVFAGAGSSFSSEASLRGVFTFKNQAWTHLSVGGEVVNDIAASKNGKVLLAATGETPGTGHLYRSTDEGGSWSMDPSLLGWFTAVAIDSFQTGNGYLASGSPDGVLTVYSSSDSGASWKLFHTGDLVGEVPTFARVLKGGGDKALVVGSNTAISYYLKLGCTISSGKLKGKPALSAELTEGPSNASVNDFDLFGITSAKIDLKRGAKVVKSSALHNDTLAVSYRKAKPGVYQAVCTYVSTDGETVALSSRKVRIK